MEEEEESGCLLHLLLLCTVSQVEEEEEKDEVFTQSVKVRDELQRSSSFFLLCWRIKLHVQY